MLPSSLKSLGAYSFAESDLESIEFEAGSCLERIDEGAFYDSNLRSILIPSSVQVIGPSAFAESSLEEIKFEAGSRLLMIDSEAFLNTNLSSIVIPASAKTLGDIGVTFEYAARSLC